MGMEIIALGEALVEVMRVEVDDPLDRPSTFMGPFPSGAPAIFADAAARLGHRVGFVGAVGDDDFGSCLLDRLAADGLNTAYCPRISDRATGVAFVTYFSDGSRRFLYHIAHAAAGQMPDPDPAYLQQARFLHICGSSLSVSERMQNSCYRAAEIVAAAGGRISFDPNLRPELLGGEDALRRICAPVLEKAYVVLPSGAEAELLSGVKGPEEACRALLTRGPKVVALKRGARGCSIFTPEQKLDVPAYPVEAVDPTGAGDCFDAGFVVGLLEELPLEQVGLPAEVPRSAAPTGTAVAPGDLAALAKVGRLANACGALGATRKGPMEGAFARSVVEQFLLARSEDAPP